MRDVCILNIWKQETHVLLEKYCVVSQGLKVKQGHCQIFIPGLQDRVFLSFLIFLQFLNFSSFRSWDHPGKLKLCPCAKYSIFHESQPKNSYIEILVVYDNKDIVSKSSA